MSIDSSLEEAGELAGASRVRILGKITFPLVIPALLSGFIMTFSKVMGTFGGPNVLGVPVRYYTVSTMIRSNIAVGAFGDAFVLAITLILFSMTTIYINQRIVGTTEKLRDDRRTRFHGPEDEAARYEIYHCCVGDHISGAGGNRTADPADLEHVDAQIRRLQPEQLEPGALDWEEQYPHQQRRTGHFA